MNIRSNRLLMRFMMCALFPLCTSQSQTIALDGEWAFAVDTAGEYTPSAPPPSSAWRLIQVPGSWQAQFADLRDYQGIAWYRKHIHVPELAPDRTILLAFDAVDYLAKVYVNGALAGEHEGGYLPFTLDIRRWVRTGDNVILVRVLDPVATEQGTEGISYWHIPHGKQNWYVQTSGLWQSARLQIKPRRFIRNIRITTGLDGTVQADVSLAGEGRRPSDVVAMRILSPEGREVASASLPEKDESVRLCCTVRQPELWHFDTPRLYTAEVTTRTDRFTDRFGFRTIETRNGQVLLNGDPVYLIGALDQDFYPESVYTTPSEEYLRDEMLKAKQLGLNMLRCHIKVPDPRYLKAADEVGLLVWCEIPNWDVFTPASAQRGETTLLGMLERDWNHPSLVILSLINESWGIDLNQLEQRKWLSSAFDRAKSAAVGRLVVDNSACWGNFHLKTDLNDYHTYWAIPENAGRFARTIADVAARPAWLFSPHGDAQPSGSEPLLVSEFGTWGLPHLPAQRPWWFTRKFGDAEAALPEGVDERFRLHHYDEIFGTYDGLADASQQAQWTALKYEIEEIRMHSGIQGYIITEFTDINWECNGLMDMWRQPKALGARIHHIQQQDLIIPRPARCTYAPGETITVQLWYSKYSRQPLTGATLRWQSSGGIRGEVVLPLFTGTGVMEVPAVQFPAPSVNSMQRVSIHFEAAGSDGAIQAQNESEIFVIPQSMNPSVPLSTVYDPTRSLGALAQVLPADNRQEAADSTIIVTRVLDDRIAEFLKEGRTVLCFADTGTVAPDTAPFKIVRRENSWYDGNWASSLNWIRGYHSLFAGFPSRTHLGFESSRMMPRVVLADIAPGNFQDVLAGMFIGWVHLNSGTIVRLRMGKGSLLICTLTIPEAVGTDPLAALMLERLLQLAKAPEIQTDWNWTWTGQGR